jgi:hypothetical protein
MNKQQSRKIAVGASAVITIAGLLAALALGSASAGSTSATGLASNSQWKEGMLAFYQAQRLAEGVPDPFYSARSDLSDRHTPEDFKALFQGYSTHGSQRAEPSDLQDRHSPDELKSLFNR